MYILRYAVVTDQPKIRSLIRQVKINPMGLDWRRFVVAEDEQRRFLGCGQVKTHGDGSRELASIAVIPETRGQGIAGDIIRRLISQNPGPLYLTCRSTLGTFYPRFGFRRVQGEELTPYFRRLEKLARFLRFVGFTNEEMWVMVKQPGI